MLPALECVLMSMTEDSIGCTLRILSLLYAMNAMNMICNYTLNKGFKPLTLNEKPRKKTGDLEKDYLSILMKS